MPTFLPAESLEGKHLNPFPLLVLTRLSQKKPCQTLLSFPPRMAQNYSFFACAEMLMAKLLLFQKKSALLSRVWATPPNPLPIFYRWFWWLFFGPQYSIPTKELMFPIVVRALQLQFGFSLCCPKTRWAHTGVERGRIYQASQWGCCALHHNFCWSLLQLFSPWFLECLPAAPFPFLFPVQIFMGVRHSCKLIMTEKTGKLCNVPGSWIQEKNHIFNIFAGDPFNFNK